ncbi:alkaline phosphatase family protein [Streptomyces roseochromogenus]|uniref:alkaline phosphatase family protein n=1 Tax=Streptomyces roseochromogenus TaxID=285450 RepID=UPI003CC91C54
MTKWDLTVFDQHRKDGTLPTVSPLGSRVPLWVVSLWSRGGWANSRVFDHTSVLSASPVCTSPTSPTGGAPSAATSPAASTSPGPTAVFPNCPTPSP